jgi:DNA-binding Lrp family transcriptional regulator
MDEETRAAGAIGRLDERVVDILCEYEGTIAFNGLRRALRAHPESLSRALRRLEREGLVRRSATGYSAATPRPSPEDAPGRAPIRSLVASVELVPGTVPSAVLGSLAGRWFGPLRWVGIHERPGEPTLVWSVADEQGHVLLSIRHRHLRVFIDRGPGDPRRLEVERAAHEMLRFALERLPMPSSPSSGSPDQLSFAALPRFFGMN